MRLEKSRREPGNFTKREFERRVERACELMSRERLDAVLVTSETNVEYLSGFTTQFAWEYPGTSLVLPFAQEWSRHGHHSGDRPQQLEDHIVGG